MEKLQQDDGEIKDFDKFKKDKELQGKQIEKTYTSKLEPGIKLSVIFKDNNIEFNFQNDDNNRVPSKNRFRHERLFPGNN